MSAAALVLAAGEGTRMRSDLPKVAHKILGVPMVELVVLAAREAGVGRIVAVTGHKADAVEEITRRIGGIACCRQERQLGTGHAVMCARETLADLDGSLLVLSGDTPLMRADTMRGLLAERERTGAAVVVLTTRLDDASGYGRVVRGDDGELVAIVEQKDCIPEQLAIDEINTGTYCFDAKPLFAHLDRLTSDNSQSEFYLTDMVGVLRDAGLAVTAMGTDDPLETLGVNSRVQLAEAAAILQRRVNTAHMLAGVTMTDPSLVWIAPTVRLGRDVLLEPMTFLMGDTSVEEGAHVGPDSRVTDSRVGAGARVDSSVVSGARIGAGASVGPMGFLRPGTVLAAAAKAGAFVEMKNSIVGEGSKVPHLSYIGDATIGAGVNVGAGSITCNYDGRRKHPTVIGDGAFIGSDTMLVAPVRIGAHAVTGAGSVISHDVPDDALAVERGEQREIEGWAARRAAREAEEG